MADGSTIGNDAAHEPVLLATKFHAPRRRQGVIVRRRLTDLLPATDLPRLIVVSAPAGFGKSTLLADWLTGDRGPAVAWLSLDARDNDATTFWTYVVASLRTVAPGIGEAAISILHTAPDNSQAVAAALVADLQELDRPVVLVLDDYHLVEAPDLHDAVALLIEQLPVGVSVALSTRMDPPLSLGRLRAAGDLLEVRAADLRFTREEAAQYLRASAGLDLTEADVGVLETRTEGWIAALQLAALSMQGRDDVASFIDSFAGDDRFVVDYLVEEVLDRQREEVRRFLLDTSLLSRLTGSLCDAVVGGTGGRSTLERLDRANLFLVPLDDRRQWYRYHHLFADVLRARALDDDPARVSELHRRAAAWWAGQSDSVEAIHHALSGHDFARAAELIELSAPGLHRIRQEALMRSWLEALPSDLFADRPVLSIALVGARMSTGDSTGVDQLLQDVERWLDETAVGDVSGPIVADRELYDRLPAQVAVYRAALSLLHGALEDTIGFAERALDLAEPDDHLRRGSATALMGLALWASGDLVTARARYSDAIRLLLAAEHYADALGCLLAAGDMCRAQGRLDDAMDAMRDGLEILGRHPGLRGAADLHAALSEMHLERNELDQAREHLAASDALGERAGLPQHPYRSRVAAALVSAADGDVAAAIALLDEAEQLYNTDFSPSVRPIPAITARLRLRQGDLEGARRWAERRGLRADDDLSYLTEYDHMTLAHTLTALQVRDRNDVGAVDLLERLRASAETGGRFGVVIETYVVEAVARHSAGDRPGAVAALDRALTLAEPERLVRLFVDQGPNLVALLASASFAGPAAVHAKRVLAASSGERPPAAAGGLVDALSERELDVLRLLRSELSGPEIARELIVSLNTMRTHTKNIYAKLGVSSRREAVRRAGELGL